MRPMLTEALTWEVSMGDAGLAVVSSSGNEPIESSTGASATGSHRERDGEGTTLTVDPDGTTRVTFSDGSSWVTDAETGSTWVTDASGNLYTVDAHNGRLHGIAADGTRWVYSAEQQTWQPSAKPTEITNWEWNDEQRDWCFTGRRAGQNKVNWTSPDGKAHVWEVHETLFMKDSDGYFIKHGGDVAARRPGSGEWHKVNEEVFDYALALNDDLQVIWETPGHPGQERLAYADGLLRAAERAAEIYLRVAIVVAEHSGPWGEAAAFLINADETREALSKAKTPEERLAIAVEALDPGWPSLSTPSGHGSHPVAHDPTATPDPSTIDGRAVSRAAEAEVSAESAPPPHAQHTGPSTASALAVDKDASTDSPKGQEDGSAPHSDTAPTAASPDPGAAATAGAGQGATTGGNGGPGGPAGMGGSEPPGRVALPVDLRTSSDAKITSIEGWQGADGSRTYRIIGEVGASSRKRSGYARQRSLPGMHQAHAWGPILGGEAAAGIMYAPSRFNESTQKMLEHRLTEARDAAQRAGHRLFAEVTVTSQPVLTSHGREFLDTVRYRAVEVDAQGKVVGEPRFDVEFGVRPDGKVDVRSPGLADQIIDPDVMVNRGKNEAAKPEEKAVDKDGDAHDPPSDRDDDAQEPQQEAALQGEQPAGIEAGETDEPAEHAVEQSSPGSDSAPSTTSEVGDGQGDGAQSSTPDETGWAQSTDDEEVREATPEHEANSAGNARPPSTDAAAERTHSDTAGGSRSNGEETCIRELPDGADLVGDDSQTGSAEFSELPDGTDSAGYGGQGTGDQFSELPDQHERPSEAIDQAVDSNQEQPQEAAEAGEGSQ